MNENTSVTGKNFLESATLGKAEGKRIQEREGGNKGFQDSGDNIFAGWWIQAAVCTSQFNLTYF